MCFNFILLNFYFYNFINILPFLLVFYLSWSFFIKNNFYYIRLNSSSIDILKNTNFLKKFHFKILLNFSILMLVLMFFSFFFLKGFTDSFWWNHLYVSNLNYNLIIYILFISICLHIIILSINNTNNVNNIDYYFSILNLSITIPLLFLSNSLYNFIFLLEMISILIFYKFSVTKFWFKQSRDFFNKKNLLERFVSRTYTNVLFYQYWVNFFSSVIIIISIINILYIYGSTEWVFLNLINKINLNVVYFTSVKFNFFLWSSIFFGFFFKIGISPIHLFKIEVYKGIPFISVFFYTTFYFVSYFIFFSLFIYHYLNSFKLFWWFFFIIFIVFGMLYILSLLFDTNFTKAFFAYSTIANSLSFICLLIASL